MTDERDKRLTSHTDPGGSFAETVDSTLDESTEPGEAGELPMMESGDRYRIGSALGQGGMALVHEARDRRLDRVVAMKRLRPELAGNDQARRRFFSEARIMAQLDHPGAVPVFDAGQSPSGEYFYAMKKVRGVTLKLLLQERPPEVLRDQPSLMHLVDIYERVVQTVAAAHDEMIIHRDLKPENVMVDDLGVVYVMDWGLAKRLPKRSADDSASAQQTQLGAVMGTPAYMAPEQAAGHSATSDRQADVFSLGVILYEILAGLNPFAKMDPHESMKGILLHNPQEPRLVNRRAPRALSAICMKALAKDPFERYPSARELAADIRRFREHLTVSAYSPRLVEKVASWARRRPATATFLATAAGLALVASLAIAAQASVERALVAQAHHRIEEIDQRIEEIDRRMRELSREIKQTQDSGVLQTLSRERARLDAEREVAELQRVNTAMAIVGFTIFAPEERAQSIIRENLVREIRDFLDQGDLERARAVLEMAERSHGANNVFGFSDDDFAKLKETLTEVRQELERQESAPVAEP